MPKLKNYIGFRSGTLIGKSIHGRQNNKVLWEFECSLCGKATIYPSGAIQHTKRTTALQCEHCGHRKQSHGYTGTSVHNAWRNMINRCTCDSNPQWSYYGGRGITVTARWLTFLNFLADMGEPPFDGASIDRKNNDEGYSKSNCRWATPVEQANNQRPKKNTLWVLLDGSPVCLADAARATNKKHATLYSQYKKGVRSFASDGTRSRFYR